MPKNTPFKNKLCFSHLEHSILHVHRSLTDTSYPELMEVIGNELKEGKATWLKG